MRRRDFVTLLAGAAVAWPRAARAQQPQRTRRIGLLLAFPESDPVHQQFVATFVRTLPELGWTQGVNVQLDYRWCGYDAGRIQSAAREIVDSNPDVILAESALTLAPLRQMTTTIPIVFVQLADPVGAGFVASLARPGGNITGFALAEFETSGKLVELLNALAPAVNRVVVIYNPVQGPQVGLWQAIKAAAPSLGVEASAVSAVDADTLTHTIQELAGAPGVGLIVLTNPTTNANRGLIIDLVAQRRLPAIYQYAYYVREGGLASYGTDPAVQYREAAYYVDRILKGDKPGDLPVQLATKFVVAVNMKAAKALGLTVPLSLLGRADEVVE
jgi:putative tryptophan/tyrosine transport system substrate-binding protein